MSSNFLADKMKATLFVHAWALRLDELDKQAKENVLHLYSLLGYQFVQEWDVSAKRLSNVIHPKRLEKLINNSLPAEVLLNANLTFLYYYGHILEQEGIERSFSYVADYMEEKTFSEEQLYKLTLFFNNWSQYERTVETLLKSFDSNTISNDNLKVLAHTAVGYNLETKDEEKYLAVMNKLKQVDETYWCNWLNQEYQIRRSLEIKQMFCETCAN
jgi:hypothetical protein